MLQELPSLRDWLLSLLNPALHFVPCWAKLFRPAFAGLGSGCHSLKPTRQLRLHFGGCKLEASSFLALSPWPRQLLPILFPRQRRRRDGRVSGGSHALGRSLRFLPKRTTRTTSSRNRTTRHNARLRAATDLLPHATRDTQERRRVRSRSRSRLGRGREAVSRPGPRQMREHRMQAPACGKPVLSQANTLSLNSFIVPAVGSRSIRPRALPARPSCAKAFGVETPTGGVTTTTCNGGRSGSG